MQNVIEKRLGCLGLAAVALGLNFVQRCPGLNQRSPGLIRCRGLEQLH